MSSKRQVDSRTFLIRRRVKQDLLLTMYTIHIIILFDTYMDRLLIFYFVPYARLVVFRCYNFPKRFKIRTNYSCYNYWSTKKVENIFSVDNNMRIVLVITLLTIWNTRKKLSGRDNRENLWPLCWKFCENPYSSSKKEIKQSRWI